MQNEPEKISGSFSYILTMESCKINYLMTNYNKY